MENRVCRYGPYDGAQAESSSDAYVYIDSDGRVSLKPSAYGVLYEYMDDKNWLFAGHNAYVCSCGCLVKQSGDLAVRKQCPICGAKRKKRKKTA